MTKSVSQPIQRIIRIAKGVVPAGYMLLLFVFQPLSAQAQDKYLKLKAHMMGEVEMWDGQDIRIWGFIDWDSLNADVLPSPVLVFNEGDSVQLLVDNISEMPHTVHLHGLDVDQENDGVPGTSFQINGYNAGYYHFRTDKPGTYLYHCHVETVIHLQMGMYGVIVVRPAAGDHYVYDTEHQFDKEYIWLSSEIDSEWHVSNFLNGQQPEMYAPDYVLVNGKAKQQISSDSLTRIHADKSDTVLLRLANMGYGIHSYTFPESLQVQIIGSDGRKLPSSYEADSLALYPGERYAVLLHSNNTVNEGNIRIQYFSNYKMQKWGENDIPFTFKEPVTTHTSDFTRKSQEKEFVIRSVKYNPTELSASIQFNLNKHADKVITSVYTLDGKTHHRKSFHANSNHKNTFDIHLNNVTPGIYVLQVLEGNMIHTEKILLK